MMNNFALGSTFTPINGVLYRIVGASYLQKSWTVNENSKFLDFEEYRGTPNQLFMIYQNGNKFAFVDQFTKTGIYVCNHQKTDHARLMSDPGQHPSSWFELIRKKQNIHGIKTFCDKSADINYSNLRQIQQYSTHQNQRNTQSFIFVPQIQVSNIFMPISGQQYKIVHAMLINRCFTVDKNSKEVIFSQYNGEPNQKFIIYQNGNKFAFIDQFTNTGLYVDNNSNNESARIKADPKQNVSSWFQIVKMPTGQLANMSYLIKTLAGKAVDSGGPQQHVHQWGIHHGPNQAFLIVPADQPLYPNEVNNGSNNNTNNNQGFIGQINNFGAKIQNVANIIKGWGK